MPFNSELMLQKIIIDNFLAKLLEKNVITAAEANSIKRRS